MTTQGFEGIMLADVVSTGLGRKFSKVVPNLHIQSTVPMASPFGASAFPGASAQRLSLDLRCADPKVRSLFERLDAWAPGELAENSERIFGKKMSLEQVLAGYKPCLRCKEGFVALLHTKVTFDGPNGTTFWDHQKYKCPPPSDLKNCAMLVRITVPHLWISSGSFGFVCNLESCQLVPEEAPVQECPF